MTPGFSGNEPDTKGPSVLPGGPIDVRAPVEAFGGGSVARATGPETDAEGMSAVTRSALNLYSDQKDKADQLAVLDAGTQFSNLETAILHQPGVGALNQQGKNAFTTPETSKSAWDEGVSQVMSGLTNDTQKQAAQRLAAQHWNNINSAVQEHVSSEFKQVSIAHTDAAVEAESNAAIANFTNPDRVSQAITKASAAIQMHGQMIGADDQEVSNQIAKTTSAVYSGVVSRMLANGMYPAATKALADHQSDILPNELDKLTKDMRVGEVRGESQAAAGVIAGLLPNIGLHDLDPGGVAWDKLQQISDPEVRDETETRVRRRIEDVAAEKRQDLSDARDRANAAIIKSDGHLDAVDPGDQALIQNGSPSAWEELSHAAKEIHNDKVNPKNPGDPDKFTNFLAMSATSPATKQALRDMNVKDVVNDSTMNDSQKNMVIRLIQAERTEQFTDLKRQQDEADHEATLLEGIVKRARDNGDDEAVAANEPQMHAAQQKAAVLRGQVQRADRTAHGTAPASPVVPTTGRAPASAAAPTAAPGSFADLGLHPVGPPKPLTKTMETDITAFGQGYADYLRKMGYNAPKIVPKPPQPQ